jgi:hypothetical protein
MAAKPRFVLGGPGDGHAPSWRDILDLFTALTCKTLTPEDPEHAAAKAEYEEWIATLPPEEKPQ